MIYRSNLTAPDLAPAFRHSVCRVLPVSHGHDVLSDWADKGHQDPTFGIYRECGFLTHDEAAILYQCAIQVPGGRALDIGAHTGWTSLHMAAAGMSVDAVEPMLDHQDFLARIKENIENAKAMSSYRFGHIELFNGRSDQFIAKFSRRASSFLFSGVMVDGDHGEPNPIMDALIANSLLKDSGFVLFHDGRGGPVQRAAEWLSLRGYNCRVYWTPNVMILCWRGIFIPPHHEPDPKVKAAQTPLLRGFSAPLV